MSCSPGYLLLAQLRCHLPQKALIDSLPHCLPASFPGILLTSSALLMVLFIHIQIANMR